MFAHLFGVGKISSFPGTLASIVTAFFVLLSFIFLNKETYILILILSILIGVFSIRHTQKNAGQKDWGWIVIDEWIGMWIAGLFLFEANLLFNEVLLYLFVALVLFRIFDISKKVPPISTINKYQNQTSMNVILDDVVAGLYTYALMVVILIFSKKIALDFNFFINILLILLPAMIANMTPVLLKFSWLQSPINEKLFGKNKTWRGFIGAILAGTLATFILYKIGWLDTIILSIQDSTNTTLAISTEYILMTGFLLGFGAIFGDLIKSFFKRKNNIPSGESFVPWDQIDFVIGAIVFTYPIFKYGIMEIIFMLILGAGISALSHRLAYILRLINTKQ
ncbi:MAG: phosphatidylglycerophosphatase A [Candidatus Pacebacteria bacterium]|nr:phosphatidylglycerophosphatase A [Candidatus Paceibacterota bacterium]MCF7862761.1 phosphatidylglycerophosphatase A [Candidatus Paceibacterota bacterium]